MMTHSRRWVFSLRLTLVGAVIVPMLGVMMGFSLSLLWYVERHVERQLQREMELVAQSVRQPIAYSLALRRDGSIQQALESAFDTRRVFSAHVYDAAGDLVATLGRLEPRAADHRRIRQVALGRPVGGYERIEGREVYSYFLPLTDVGGRLTGLLQVTRHRAEIDQLVGEMRQQAWRYLGVAALLLVIVVLAGHHWFIGQPLRRMSGVMHDISAGARDRRAAERGPGEIAALGRAFNAMMASVSSAEREISAQRQRQLALEHELRRKEQLAGVGRLAAGVAHEMGSPLAVIDGHAQRGLRQRPLTPARRDVLIGVRAEVERLTGIVRQLLTLGQSAAQQRDVADLDTLCRQALTAVRSEADRHGTRVQYQCDGGRVLIVDAMRLQQALIQLLRNAIQAAPEGRVTLTLAADGDASRFVVDDSGDGVPDEVRALLFEPFFTTKPTGQGSGLGLAVAERIVADHGGSIEVSGSPLGGARFWLVLPAERAAGGER
jgi:two-component system, NtrC family, sensor kinase